MSRLTARTIPLASLLMVAFSIVAGCSDPSGSGASIPASTTDEAPQHHAYHSDLENTVILAMRRGMDDTDLMHQIDSVARRHGLADWGSDEETFAAIGAGLRHADVSSEMAATVAQLVSRGDATRRDLVLQAYGS